ncbi:putative Secreted protein [Streptomyces viridochromogenes Tue57]|uniref:Putative Secreted protein n=1 Tax=Streptomyces viridochromogenes Tue57 TaxID=1160705 RepID=L8PIY8_STRVR|nr:putative Secreted protein [Streptomyces viridochromogenes Tue57]
MRSSRAHCSWLVRGIGAPAWAHAWDVRPEQSYDFGPSAPHLYGFPSCFLA